MKDNPNDWLQQEMDYEGFIGRKGTFKEAHLREENSTGWNAGTKKLAQIHSEQEHNGGYNAITTDNNNLNKSVKGIINTLIFVVIISIIKRIFSSYTVLSYTNMYYEQYLIVNGVFNALLCIGILLIVFKVLRLVFNRRK